MAPIPITIVTGFLGSGKTTLILNLIPQLPKDYKIALLKNEFGDLAIDSQLAASASISGVQELLNGCICCNLVGQLGPALSTLSTTIPSLDRIIIETSGSAFPATLAIEINRLARETGGAYVLDGVISVIDVENWQGYEDTSYTAKMQARYTDLVVLNKWEVAGERRMEDVRDRLGDLEVEVAVVRSEKGRVDAGVLLGLDGRMAREMGGDATVSHGEEEHAHDHHHDGHGDTKHHQQEVEVLSVTLSSSAVPNNSTPATESKSSSSSLNLDRLDRFLNAAPKDEIYRIKAIIRASSPPKSSSGDEITTTPTPTSLLGNGQTSAAYILNWAFGRWTFTPLLKSDSQDSESESDSSVLRMTIILARGEANAWKKKIEVGGWFDVEGSAGGGVGEVEKLTLEVKRLL